MTLSNDSQRLIKDSKTWTNSARRKYLYSVCCCSIYFLLGWNFQIIGPVLIELQFLTGVTFTLASTYLTALDVSHVVGALETGLLYGKVSPYILVIINLCVTITFTVAIPFCSSYIPMLLVHICVGISTGALNTVILAEISALWGSEKESSMHALHFAMAFGTVLSPIVVNPFLRNFESYEGNVTKNLPTIPDNSSNLTYLKYENYSLFLPVDDTNNSSEPSRLYIAYLITAGLTLLVLIPFLVILLRHVVGKFEIYYSQEHITPKKAFAGKEMCAMLLLVGLVSTFQTSLEATLSDFLPSFCIQRMNWTSQNGAYAVSVFRGSVTIGRLSGIALAAMYCSSIKLALMHSFLLIVSVAGLIVSGLYYLDYGIWISSVLAGLGLSVLAPCMINVIEENIFAISGKIATYFVSSSFIGYAMLAPAIGYFMENISEMYFGYVLLFESVTFIILILVCKVTIHTLTAKQEKTSLADNMTDVDGM